MAPSPNPHALQALRPPYVPAFKRGLWFNSSESHKPARQQPKVQFHDQEKEPLGRRSVLKHIQRGSPAKKWHSHPNTGIRMGTRSLAVTVGCSRISCMV